MDKIIFATKHNMLDKIELKDYIYEYSKDIEKLDLENKNIKLLFKKQLKQIEFFYKNTIKRNEILNKLYLFSKDIEKTKTELIVKKENILRIYKKNGLYIFLALIIILLYEFIYVFRPLKGYVKEKMQEIDSAKSYLDIVIESDKNAIIAIDKNKTILTFNKSAENMFGYSKEEMLYTSSLNNIIPDKYIDAHNRGLDNFLKTGISAGTLWNSIELEGKRKNGEIFPIRISFGVNEDLENLIIIANIQDITYEKRQDSLLLQQSRYAALGEMIGNIAHQWRQPLSAISTIASGAKFRKKLGQLNDNEVLVSFEKIVKHTKFLSDTIDDFRNFFKRDKQKIEFDLFEVVNESITLIEASYKNNSIRVIKKFDQANLRIMGYPSELLQVLLNILSNAKDVLIDRDIKNRIVIIVAKKIDNKALIEICDNAGGIDEDIIHKIFDPYFTTKHQSHGTGIGLFMSKEIIQKHFNSDINVKNKNFTIKGKAYKGACFKIEIDSKT